MRDPRWKGFDDATKKAAYDIAFEDEVAADPKWESLSPETKAIGRKIFFEDIAAEEARLAIEEAPEKRGWAASLASGAARGVVRMAGHAGHALELAADLTPREVDTETGVLDTAGRGIVDWSKRVQQEYDFLKQDKAELSGETGFFRRGVVGAAENIPMSLPIMATAYGGAKVGAGLGFAAGGPAGAAVGAAVGGVTGAIAGLVTFFGAGTYGEEYSSAYKELERTRPEATAEERGEVAHRVALKSAVLEVGTEIPGTLLGLRMLGGAKVLTQPIKATLLNVLEMPRAEFAKKFALAAAGEVGGEMIAGGGQAYVRKEEGLSGPTVTEGVLESIIPSLGISLFFGASAAGYNKIQTRKMINSLNSEDEEIRGRAIKTMAYRLAENTQDNDLALAWLNEAVKTPPGHKFDIHEKVADFAKVKIAEEYQEQPLRELDTTGIGDATNVDDALDTFTKVIQTGASAEHPLGHLRVDDPGLTLSELSKLPAEDAQRLLADEGPALFKGQQVDYTTKKGTQRVLLLDQNEDGTWNAKGKDGGTLTVLQEKATQAQVLEPGREVTYQTKRGEISGVLIEPLGETAWRAKETKNGKPFTALVEKITPVPIEGERFEPDKLQEKQEMLQAEPVGQLKSQIDEIAHEAATSSKNDKIATPDMLRAGNYAHGKITEEISGFPGRKIMVETARGETRSEKKPKGAGEDWAPGWSTEMKGGHYGYWVATGKEFTEGVKSADINEDTGRPDKVDVMIGEDPTSQKVFVIDQIDPNTKKFDEPKTLIHYPDAETAKSAYLSSYEPGWKGLGAITEMTKPQFDAWLGDGKRKTEPVAYGKTAPETVPEAIEWKARKSMGMSFFTTPIENDTLIIKENPTKGKGKFVVYRESDGEVKNIGKTATLEEAKALGATIIPSYSTGTYEAQAKKSGIIFNGVQENVRGKPGIPLFTDPVVKTTFSVQEGEDLPAALIRVRKIFWERDKVLTEEALDQGIDVPEDIVTRHRIEHDMIGINAHLKARRITPKEHSYIVESKRIARSLGVEPTWKEVDHKATETSTGVPLQLDMSLETGRVNREKIKADFNLSEEQLQDKLDKGATYGIYAEYQNRDYSRRVAARRGERFRGPKSIFYSGARLYEYPHEDAHHFIAEGVFGLNIPPGATAAQAAAVEERVAIEFGEGMEAAHDNGTAYEFLEAFKKKYPPKASQIFEKMSTRTPEPGKMTSNEFEDYIAGLPLKDSFGELDINDVKQIARSADTWTLKAVNPETLEPVDIKVKTKFPIIISHGDVLDGRRRQYAAMNRGDKAIMAWVGEEAKGEPTATTGRGKEPWKMPAEGKEWSQVSVEEADRAAFGFARGDIKTLKPEQLSVKWEKDYENAIEEQEDSGLSKEAWAKNINLTEPIDVIYEDGKFKIDDGHHRYYAAKILNKPLNVSLDIKDKPHEAIIRKALAEGKPVPADVLKSYPDLQSPELGKGATGVVMEDGKPKLFYRGDRKETTTGPFYFADAERPAKRYGKVQIVNLVMKAPKEIDYEGREDNDLAVFDVPDAIEEGYDSLIARNASDGKEVYDQYIVFSKDQIKSPEQGKGKPAEKPEIYTGARVKQRLRRNEDVYLEVQKIHRDYDDFIEGNLGERLDEYDHYELKKLKLSALDLDEWNVQEGLVYKIAAEMRANPAYPPIVVSADMSIIDGIHRANAWRGLGNKSINAYVGVKEVKGEPTATTGRGKEPGVPRLSTREQRIESAQGRARRTYPEAIKEEGNPWIRLTDASSNKGRVLMIQFTTELMGKSYDQATKYYEKLYKTREGYVKEPDFWEIPTWIGNVAQFTESDVYIVRDMKEAKDVLPESGYDAYVFSSMDVNKALIEDLGKTLDNVHVGGSTKVDVGTWHETLPSLAQALGTTFKDGASYRHFKGTAVIPRLTLSQGCKYKCAFCEVTKKLTLSSPVSVKAQVESFKDLHAELIYLNDKTFGQADNYQYLSKVNAQLKEQNPEFKGFIIQTTASDLMRLTPEFLKASGIKYVELGVESYNDFILRGLHKPHNERVIDLAAQKLRELNINFVPNVIIGIPEETSETYQKTLDFFKRNQDIISHANIYNLALYEGTELKEKIGVKEAADVDENIVGKSFHTDKQIHQDFADQIYGMMEERLNEGPAYSRRPDSSTGIYDTRITKEARKEMREVVAKARKNKTYLKAPNGEPTALSPTQWALVRTSNFKTWFGDWEEFSKKEGGVWAIGSEGVSKVVDKNGEPLVVFHGTKKGGFSVIDPDKRDKHAVPSTFFTDNERMAGTYGGRSETYLPIIKTQKDLEDIGWEFETKDDGYVWGYAPDGSRMIEEKGIKKAVAAALDEQVNLPAGDQRGQYSVFLNIRNPYEDDFEGANWDGSRNNQWVVADEDGELHYDKNGRAYFDDKDDAYALADEKGGEVGEAPEHYETTNSVAKMAKREGNDGAIIRQVTDSGGVPSGYAFEPADVFVIFKPEQAKSAIWNTGTFDPKNEDLRYSVRQEREYIKAIKAGDMETAQKMVDAKAKAAGYTVGPVYHGTAEPAFTEFSSPSYFAESKEYAQIFQANALNRRKIKNPNARTESIRLSGDVIDLTDAALDVMDSEDAQDYLDSKGAMALIPGEFTKAKHPIWFYLRNAVVPKGYNKILKFEEEHEKAKKETIAYKVFDPSQIKSADPVTYDDEGNIILLWKRFRDDNPDIRYSARGFYSQLERAANLPDLPSKAQSLIPYLQKKNVKPAELKWMGVEQWVKENQADGEIDRDKFRKFLKSNQIEVKEIQKGAYTPNFVQDAENHWVDDEARLAIKKISDKEYEIFDNYGSIGDAKSYEKAIEKAKAIMAEEPEDTKFSQWQLPGGENYKELLLTLPLREGKIPEGYSVEEIDYGRGDVKYFAVTPTTRSHAFEKRSDAEAYMEKQIKDLRPFREKLTAYKSSHWDEPNVLGHVRMNDRVVNGEKILFIEEIQSDWGQEGKKKGYGEVPSFPFVKNWTELLFKRVLRWAAEHGDSPALVAVSKPDSVWELAENLFGTENSSMMPLQAGDGGVLSLMQHDQVKRAVIRGISVDVMGMLKKLQTTAKDILSDPSVLAEPIPIETRRRVLSGILDAARGVGAELRTKLLDAQSAGRDVQLFPTLSASDLDAREIIGVLAPESIYHVGLHGATTDLNITGPGAVIGAARKDLGREHLKSLPASSTDFLNTPVSAFRGAEPGGKVTTRLDLKEKSTSLADVLDWHNKILSQAGSLSQVNYTPGYQKLAWTTGEQQSERYDLSKQVDEVSWMTRIGSPNKAVGLFLKNSQKLPQVVVDPKGNIVEGRWEGQKLEDVIGKELSKRVLTAEKGSLTGVDLKIGGEGMEVFYDKLIPGFAEKYVKQWGSRVVKTEIPVEKDVLPALTGKYKEGQAETAEVWSVAITDPMKESVMQGQPMFSTRDLPARATLTHWTTKEDLKKASPKFFGTGSQGAEKFREAMPVVYYGVPPYQKEAFVRGPFMYTATTDGTKIYDMEKDPLNLYPSDERMKKAGAQLTEINTRRYLYEKDIKKAGFDGYYVRSRAVVGMFIPLDVEPRKAGSKALPHPKFSARTDTLEFKKWFKDSKVVDENGKPLVVYHGTTHDFDRFDMGEEGAFFAAKPSVAGVFTLKDPEESYTDFDEGASIMPVYLSIRNPLTITPDEYLSAKIGNRYEAEKAGYDGIRITPNTKYGPEWSADVWVAFSPEQIKSATGNVGTYDATNPDIRYSTKIDKGARILAGEDTRKFETLYQAANYLTRRKVIDHTDATTGDNREVEKLLLEFLDESIKKYPESVEWYRKDIGDMHQILQELEPNLKKPDHKFRMTLAIALNSNGNTGVKTVEMGYETYRNWADNDVYMPTGDTQRGDAIRGHFEIANALSATFKTDKAFEKWLLEKRPVSEIRQDAGERLGIDGNLLIGYESPTAVVPAAAIFGPKLGAFFANLSGDFSQATMDRWFMRTMGRMTGTLLRLKEVQPYRDTLRKALTEENVTALWGEIRPEVKDLTDEDIDEIALRVFRGAWRDITDEDLRKAGNALGRVLNGELRDAPRGPKHRGWMRDRMEGVIEKRPLTMSAAQAGLWFGEKGVYRALGIKGERADYYSDGARILYEKLRGELPGRFARPARQVRRDAKTSVSEPLFSTRDEDYLKAVNQGDLEAAQKMVDEAAKKAGYKIAAAHGTDVEAIFTAFKRRSGDIGIHFGTEGQAQDRLAYIRSRESRTPGPTPRIMKVYLDIKNPLRLYDAGRWDHENLAFQLREQFPQLARHPWDDKRGKRTTRELREIIQASGYDGIVYENTGEVSGAHTLQLKVDAARKAMTGDQRARGKALNAYDPEDQETPVYKALQDAELELRRYREDNAEDSYIIFERNQVKSADPVTYDDKGNVIPLSKRFKGGPDIRYSARVNELVKDNPDGFTINIHKGILETSGYAVAPSKTTETTLPADTDVDGYLKRYALVFASDDRAKLGGWKQGNKLILDVAYVFPTLKEAVYVGDIGNQKAVGRLGEYKEYIVADEIAGMKDRGEYSEEERDTLTSFKEFIEGPKYSTAFKDTLGPVTEKEYEENRILQAQRRVPKLSTKDFTAEVSRLMAPISTRLKLISPALAEKLRRLDRDTNVNIMKSAEMVSPLLKKAKGMTKDDAADWDYARKNSNVEKINELVKKYKMEEEYASTRKMFDDLRAAAIEVGLDIGEIEEYWTRKVSDLEGLYAEMNREELGVFSKALAEKAASFGMTVDQLDPDLRATLITNVMFGGPSGPGGSALTKERKFQKIPPRLNKYYMHSDQAVMEHIHAMVTAIEKRKFFGKIPERVSETRRQLYVAQAKVREWEQRVRTADLSEISKSRQKLLQWDGETRLLEGQIWKYSLQRDYQDNIGSLVFDLIAKGEISGAKENEVNEILSARFNAKGAQGWWQLYKNFSYIDTMGSPISALTQIGDLAWAFYEVGLIKGTKHAFNAATGQSKITRKDVGLERIAEEFADSSRLGAAVNWVFKWTGLEKMDAIGKEALLNAALEKYQTQARENPGSLKISHIFGEETEETTQALKDGEITDNVKMLVYSRLADFQPIGLSEMPQRYLTSGNGRVFYMLKTFTIKQFDIFRNEAIHKITHGDSAEKIQGMKNLVKLAMFFVLANAAADELKDFVLGRKTDFSDRVMDNVLRLAGSSKFVTWTARTEGIGSALSKQILPPFKFIDSASKDIYNAGDDKGLELTGSIPLLGKLAYWHLGRGTSKRKDIWDIRLSKYRQNVTDVHEDYEKSKDKSSFMREHHKELAEYHRLTQFQGRINNYRKIVNQLKSRPETDSTKKRIEQLEERRTELIKNFLKEK